MIIKYIPNIFDKERRTSMEVDYAYQSVGDYLEQHVADSREGFVAIVGGEPVDMEFIPCAEDEIVFVQDIADSGALSKIIGGILVVVGVALIWTGWGTWVAAVGVSMLVGAAVGFAATLFAPNMATSGKGDFSSSPTYSWGGVQNIVGEGSTVPVVYGEHRMGGVIIEGWVDGENASGSNAKQYLNMLLALSEGPIEGVREETLQINKKEAAYYNVTGGVSALPHQLFPSLPLTAGAEQTLTTSVGAQKATVSIATGTWGEVYWEFVPDQSGSWWTDQSQGSYQQRYRGLEELVFVCKFRKPGGAWSESRTLRISKPALQTYTWQSYWSSEDGYWDGTMPVAGGSHAFEIIFPEAGTYEIVITRSTPDDATFGRAFLDSWSEYGNFNGLWYGYRLGHNSQQPLDNFSRIVKHYAISGVPLRYNKPYIYKTNGEVDQVQIDVESPALFNMNDDGGLESFAVSVGVEYAEYQGTGTESYISKGAITLSGAQTTETRSSMTIQFPKRGTYLIRLNRLTGDVDGNPRMSGSTSFSRVLEIENGLLSYPCTALLGLRILANDRLSGSTPTISVVVKGKVIKDVRTGTVAFSKNPANILYDILTNKVFGLGRWFNDTNIDIEAFRRWADFCDEIVTYRDWDSTTGAYVEKSEKRFEFNIVLDQPYQAIDIIQKIASSCRAIPYWIGDKFSLVIEKADVPVQMFNASRIVADSLEESYTGLLDVPGQIQAQFLDEDNDYEKDSVIGVDRERVRNNEEFTSQDIQLFGFTKKSRVKRAVAYAMRRAKGVRKKIKFSTSIMGVVSTVGDVILMQYEHAGYGYGGLVFKTEGSTVFLDKAVTVEAGKQYNLRVRKADNTFVVKSFTAAQNASLTSIEGVGTGIGEGDLWAFGPLNKEAKPFRVMNLVKKTDYTVAIEGEEYNESIFTDSDEIEVRDANYSLLNLTDIYEYRQQYDEATGEPQDPVVTWGEGVPQGRIDRDAVPPYVTQLGIQEKLARIGNVYAPALFVTFPTINSFQNSINAIQRYDVLISDDEGATWRVGDFTTNGQARITSVEIGKKYYVVVKPYTIYGVTNNVEQTDKRFDNFITVTGKDYPPGAPAGLTGFSKTIYNRLYWQSPNDEDLAIIEVWAADSNDRAQASAVGEVRGASFDHLGIIVGRRYYYWIRARDTSGNVSNFHPYDPMGGVEIIGASSPSDLLDALEGNIDDDMFVAPLRQRIGDIDAIQNAITGDLTWNQLVELYGDDAFVREIGDIAQIDGRVSKAFIDIDQLNNKLTLATGALDADLDAQRIRLTTAEQTLQSYIGDGQTGEIWSRINSAVTAGTVGLNGQIGNLQNQLAQASQRIEAYIYAEMDRKLVAVKGEITAGIEETVRTEINDSGAMSQYTLRLQAGNRIAGISIGVTPLSSEFAVLADTFKICQGSADAPRTVFTVGSLNGQSTVGIRGDMILDGTIRANSLNVGTLSAVSANLGTVTAGKLQGNTAPNFIDLNAVGDQVFLQVADAIQFRANGLGYLKRGRLTGAELVASGTYNVNSNDFFSIWYGPVSSYGPWDFACYLYTGINYADYGDTAVFLPRARIVAGVEPNGKSFYVSPRQRCELVEYGFFSSPDKASLANTPIGAGGLGLLPPIPRGGVVIRLEYSASVSPYNAYFSPTKIQWALYRA